MSHFVKSAAIFAALAICAPMAMAERPPMSVAVSYGDLNLDNQKGMDALFSRIKRAAREVCGGTPAMWSNNARARLRACEEATLANAIRRIGNPTVTLAWAEKTAARMRIATR